MEPSEELLNAHHALIRSDHPFLRRARLLQSLWREAKGLDFGLHRGRPLGSLLAMPFAKESLANYMTETIREVVRDEVLGSKSRGKLYEAPRIFDNLLSSQPLCFNLFGELQQDLALASRTFETLLGEAGLKVSAIEFEHSPGRGDARFTSDRSAFDVFVAYSSESTKSGFVGIEVKYVENMEAGGDHHRPRYDEVADKMGAFRPESRERLRRRPLEQIWRDHLLAGSLLQHAQSGFDRGTFALVYPSGNTCAGSAVSAYRACLSDASTFTPWTLEQVLDAIEAAGAGEWAREVRHRYLGTQTEFPPR